METIKRVDPVAWECSICKSIMDGENKGEVSISSRCYHIFHRICIEKELTEYRSTCPICKLANFSIIELHPNEEFPKQCQKWKIDPEGYNYEKAFREQYQHNRNPNLKETDILKPVPMRGLPSREYLTRKEVWNYSSEISRQIDAFNPEKDSLEKMRKLRAELDTVEHLQLDHLLKDSAGQLKALKKLDLFRNS